MPTIKFLPTGKSAVFKKNTNLLEAARKINILIDSPCGGEGTCGKCIVKIVEGNVNSDSLGILTKEELAEGYVLACRTNIMDEDITVEIPKQIGKKYGKFTSIEDDMKLIRRELFPKKWHYSPLAQKWLIKVAEPRLEDGLSDLDRLTNAVRKETGDKEIFYSFSVIKSLAEVLRQKNGSVTVTIIFEKDKYHIIEIEPGNETKEDFGLVIDIGTTTVALQLVYLPTTEIVASISDYNEQIDCGLDVISRINYARKPERLAELKNRVLNTINRLLDHLSTKYKINKLNIYNAVISGNTTMIHLLLGLYPEYIRLKPYTPTILEVPYITAKEIGINIHPESWIYISPAVGSYVGGDITAGILCTDISLDSEDINLFIDIGTNGEIAVGNNEFIMTCACSAGPAFEGGGIAGGMRASLGAVDHVEIDRQTGKASYRTIGDVKPVGICGSGMISLLANLFLSGWIDAAGKFNRNKKCKFILLKGRKAEYIIAPGKETENGKDLVISEQDIENIIRAKAAIYSACSLILKQIGISFEDLQNIYIAGGFGRFLEIDKAVIIGLIPDLSIEKYKYIGNSSLIGGYMVLLSKEYQKKQVEIAQRMTYLELNTDPSYMDEYTGALFIPHTDSGKFPSVKPYTEKKD